jgi:hypothetical protein
VAKTKFKTLRISDDVHKILDAKRNGKNSFDATLRNMLGLPNPERTRTRRFSGIEELKIGESVVIPWILTLDGTIANQRPITDAVKYESRKTGKIFITMGERRGVKITRSS